MYWIDNHCDVLYQLWKRCNMDSSFFSGGEEKNDNLFLLDDSPLDVNYSGLIQSNTFIQNFAIFVPAYIPKSGKLGVALKQTDIFYEQIAPYVPLITNRLDLDVLLFGGVRSVLTLEGGEALCGEIANLRLFYRLGVRQIGLTWNESNELADGCKEIRGGGLTQFGRMCVEEMVRLGMIIDVSHLSDQGFWDVLSISNTKVIASHSNSRLLCPHVRNLTDEQIKALIAHDGLIGITYVPQFTYQPYTDAKREHLIEHINHIWQLGGEDHIAFGSDFDGVENKIPNLENIRDIPSFYELLTYYFPKKLIDKWAFHNAYRFYNHALA